MISINFKPKSKLILYIFIMLIFGFLLSFYYQTLIDSSVDKFKKSYEYSSAENTDNFYLLYGWQEKEGYASMYKKKAVCIFYVPKKDTVALKFTYRVYDAKQKIEVSCKENILGELKTNKTGQWSEKILVFPFEYIKEGLNKITFIKENESAVDFSKLNIMNYKDRKLIFLRAYEVWETTHWLSKRGNKPINLGLCFLGSSLFLSLWFLYSLLFWSVAEGKYISILKLDFWVYVPTVIIFSICFLVSKLLATFTFFYYKFDFWLIFAGSMSVGKFYQLIKYAKYEKVKLRIKQLKSIIVKFAIENIKRYNLYAGIFVIIFVVLLIVSAVLLMLGMRLYAEWLSNTAFLFLLIGVFLKIINYFIDKKYIEEE